MMTKSKRYQWPVLLQAFEESGLTQAEFCQQQGIDPGYFSSRRQQLLKKQQATQAKHSSFVAVTVDQGDTDNQNRPEHFILQLPGGTQWQFNTSVPPSYLAALIRALS